MAKMPGKCFPGKSLKGIELTHFQAIFIQKMLKSSHSNIGLPTPTISLYCYIICLFNITCFFMFEKKIFIENKTQGLQLRTVSESKFNPQINPVNTRGTC